jgi:hypothetical protein
VIRQAIGYGAVLCTAQVSAFYGLTRLVGGSEAGQIAVMLAAPLVIWAVAFAHWFAWEAGEKWVRGRQRALRRAMYRMKARLAAHEPVGVEYGTQVVITFAKEQPNRRGWLEPARVAAPRRGR